MSHESARRSQAALKVFDSSTDVPQNLFRNRIVHIFRVHRELLAQLGHSDSLLVHVQSEELPEEGGLGWLTYLEMLNEHRLCFLWHMRSRAVPIMIYLLLLPQNGFRTYQDRGCLLNTTKHMIRPGAVKMFGVVVATAVTCTIPLEQTGQAFQDHDRGQKGCASASQRAPPRRACQDYLPLQPRVFLVAETDVKGNAVAARSDMAVLAQLLHKAGVASILAAGVWLG